jgi:hypothetical protein
VLCYKVKSIKHSSTLNLKLELELEPNAEEIASGLHIKHRERWLMSSVPHDSDAMAEDHVLYKTLYDFSMTSCTSCIECLPKATAKLSWFVGNTLVVLNAMIYSNISSTFLYIPSCPVDAITFKPRLYRKIAAGPYCCGAGSWFFYRVMYSSWIELSEINYIEAIKHEFCIKCQIRLPKWIDRQKDLLCGSYHCRPESRNTSIL